MGLARLRIHVSRVRDEIFKRSAVWLFSRISSDEAIEQVLALSLMVFHVAATICAAFAYIFLSARTVSMPPLRSLRPFCCRHQARPVRPDEQVVRYN
jgi:hypothetical protein